jgi:hypothetical protein
MRVVYAAGAAAVALAAAYCVYFDQKRRSAPDYKLKLRARAYTTNGSEGRRASGVEWKETEREKREERRESV